MTELYAWKNPEDCYRFIVEMSRKHFVDAKNLHDLLLPSLQMVRDKSGREDLQQTLIDLKLGAELIRDQLERLGQLMPWKPPGN